MSPRHKRLKRESRLEAAKHWIPKYTGKNIVRGYRKHFGISLVCAALELQMLGYEISPDYFKQLKIDEANRQKRSEEKKRLKEMQERYDSDSNDEFYYIAGYTSSGFPYGLTWKEMGMEPYEL